MTGSTSSEGLRPQDTSPIPTGTTSFPLDPFFEGRTQHHQPRRKMTPIPPTGTPIQLTPLWEHVVRTRRFPSEIDTQSIFVEISERLRDPEWEVRQHALRVLMDVTPTLPAEIVDEVMQPVVPELINNLGHAAPAVRKGALDALRVYLVYSLDREEIVKNIFRDGLTRRENNRDNNPFQTNLIAGVILSAPSLLFPSPNTPRPSKDIIKYVTYCLASRLIQIEHQEATLRSLMKIRETIGHGEFDDILSGYDGELKKNLEVLCKVYNVKPSKKNQRKILLDDKEVGNLENEGEIPGRVWDSDSDTSGIAEEEDEINGSMPPARVVLETEIKFNEETAITMTILEEKARNSCDDDDDGNESGTDVRNENEMSNERSISERRKTPRRVHFGGEIVKLRTPDSDDTESVVVASTKTRIPLPVSPATKMPSERRRSISQPSSPHFARRYTDRRTSRSLSCSPKREVYTHNAELSPKKGILTRTSSSQLFVIEPIERKDKRNGKYIDTKDDKRETSLENLDKGTGFGISKENSINRHFVRDDKKLVRSMSVPIMIENSSDLQESFKLKTVQEKVKNLVEELSSVKKQSDVSLPQENLTDNNGSLVTADLSGKSGEKEPTREQSVNVASKIDEKVKDTVRAATTSAIKPTKCETSNVIRKVHSSKVFRRERDTRSLVVDNTKNLAKIGDSDATISSLKYNENEETRRGRTTRVKTNEDVKKEGTQKTQEPSWEELGLVDREVLDDLHNKEDWRARVRGLERVASALRTPSALIAIESRLGSLLHAVLGGERSCRVAAAGLAVAKIVVTGVTEDALKRRLPQLAWGLARQGGPSAAKLARIAMLRLKPACLLEQFLQPQCLGARNAKTRENALQLLIFSLVTFPSTEFKVETVAHKVALMVGDRRRRVRQAALDALAVLAQIYEPEEVLRAGKKASAGRHDGEPMFAAIRSRLARKSLPLVSADGLVVYGLQISPTVQIATGPDVDWIVAGSGSVSPGTGRSRRQIPATTRIERGNFLRNKNLKKYTSPWANRQNIFARGVGLRSKHEQPVVWQIVPQHQDDILSSNVVQELENRNDDINYNDGHLRATRDSQTTNSSIKGANIGLNHSKTTLINLDDNTNVRSTSVKENARNINFQDGGVYRSLSQETSGTKMESKIPILFSRGSNTKLSDQALNVCDNLDQLNGKIRKKTGFNSENRSSSLLKLRDSNFGLETMYQRRKRLQQETTTTTVISTTTSIASQVSNQTFDSHNNSYRPLSCTINSNYTSESQKSVLDGQYSSMPKVVSQNYLKSSDERYSKSSDGYLRYPRMNFERRDIEKLQTAQQQTQQQTTNALPAFETSNYQRQRQFASNPSFTPLNTTPNAYNRIYQDFQNSNHQTMTSRPSLVESRIDRRTMNDVTTQKNGEIEGEASSGGRTNDDAFVNSPFRRRIRSLSPSGLYQPEKLIGVAFKEIQTTSMFDIDKAPVNEEESNERTNNYYLPEASVYPVQVLKNEDSPHEGHERVKIRSAGSTSSDFSANNSNVRHERSILKDQRDDDSDSNSNRVQREKNKKAFDVISRKSEERDTIDSYVLPPKESESSASVESTSTSDETSKDWSSEDGIKRRKEVVILSEQDELLRDDEVTNASSENSDGIDDVDTNLETRRRSIASIISSEKVINEALSLSNESLQTNYKHFQDVSVISPSKHPGSPIRSELKFSNRAINTNDTNLDLFGSPRRDHRSPRLSPTFDDHINEILGDVNEDDLIPNTLHDEAAIFQTPEKGKSDKLNDILDSPGDSLEKITEYVDNIESIQENVESRINEDISASIEDISVYNTTEEKTTNVAFTKISNSLESFARLNDIRNELESEEAPAILKIEPQAIENTEQPIKRIPSKVPRSTTKSRIASHHKTSQYSEKTVEKYKPIVQQCFSQLENKDWEVTIKGLKSLSQLAKQHPEYLDVNIGGTIGRLLGRHIRSLRSQVSRAACIAAGDIFTSQIRGIDQDIDDIAGSLLHRTADTNRFLRADSNAALDRMIESLPPHKTIGIIVHRGANHQNAIVRGATARLLSLIVDRISAELVMILPRDVRDKLIGSGAKLLMDGNLDARNHAKKMFRRLAHCEGFRKALTDAVPETTLRHIDKTLKSL